MSGAFSYKKRARKTAFSVFTASIQVMRVLKQLAEKPLKSGKKEKQLLS